MNHIKKENINFIVAANMAGDGYIVSFREETVDYLGRRIKISGYNEVEIVAPQRGDFSHFWRVYESLYQPEKKEFYRIFLPDMLELWVDAPQEYYRRGLERLQGMKWIIP